MTFTRLHRQKIICCSKRKPRSPSIHSVSSKAKRKDIPWCCYYHSVVHGWSLIVILMLLRKSNLQGIPWSHRQKFRVKQFKIDESNRVGAVCGYMNYSLLEIPISYLQWYVSMLSALILLVNFFLKFQNLCSVFPLDCCSWVFHFITILLCTFL